VLKTAPSIDETYKKRTLPNREGLIARLNEAAHEYREKVIPFSGMGESWNYVEQAE
jgi:hypothetical protein